MPPTEHSYFSPSAAERWLVCTASRALEEQYPETDTAYTLEGRHAHAVAELLVRKKFLVMKKSEYTRELKKLQEDPLYREEMLTHAQTYVDYIAEKVMGFATAPCVAPETRVSFEEYAPGGFGTADCILVGPPVLHVNDYKYGQGVPVSAQNNVQMMLYALGALSLFAPVYGDAIQTIRMTIIQPRRDSIAEWECTRAELEEWGRTVVKPAADAILARDTVFCEGEHCRFCKAKGSCRERADVHTALEDFGGLRPPLLSDAEVGAILTRAQRLLEWYKDLETYAQSAILAGRSVEGWKIVEGRSNRAYADKDKAAELLTAGGYPEAIIYKPKELLGITDMEKVVGKKNFAALLDGQIIKPPGKPTLAPETDNRPPYSPAAADFAELETDKK